MTRIDIPVNNPKGALAAATVGAVPLPGLMLLALGFSDAEGVHTLWPLIVVMGLGCIGFLVAVILGVRFMLRGTYVIEYVGPQDKTE